MKPSPRSPAKGNLVNVSGASNIGLDGFDPSPSSPAIRHGTVHP